MKNIPTKKLKNTKRMCGYILYLYHAYFRISIFFRIFSNYVVESHTIRTRSMFVNGENYSHASTSKGRLVSPYADARILGCKNSAHIYNMCLQTF